MKYNSVSAFVPSGRDFQAAKALFQELGFAVGHESDSFIGFSNNGFGFILQKFDNPEFAENFMMSVTVDDLDEFWRELSQKDLPGKFGIKLKEPTDFPWGREVNLIDLAGVCWHFSEQK